MSRICNMCYSAQNNTIEMEVYGPKFPNERTSGTYSVWPLTKFIFDTQDNANLGITVNWNDGTEEELITPTTQNRYIQLSVPGHTTFIHDGSHTFQDGISGWRLITITVNAGLPTITGFEQQAIAARGALYKGLDKCPNLERIKFYSSRGHVERYNDSSWIEANHGFDYFPPEMLKLEKLNYFDCHFAWKYDSEMNRSIPQELFNSKIITMIYGGGVAPSFTQKETNNWENLPLLKASLKYFSSNYSGVNSNSRPDNWQENTKLNTVAFLGYSGGGDLTDWIVNNTTTSLTIQSENIGDESTGVWMDFTNNPQLRSIKLIGSLRPNYVLPKNLANAIAFKNFSTSHSNANVALLSTQEEVEEFFDKWYEETERIASKDQSTVPYSPEGVLRDMTINVSGPALTLNFTAPQDFVVGVSNGTIDPNNKLGNIFYVLKYQYNQNVSYTADDPNVTLRFSDAGLMDFGVYNATGIKWVTNTGQVYTTDAQVPSGDISRPKLQLTEAGWVKLYVDDWSVATLQEHETSGNLVSSMFDFRVPLKTLKLEIVYNTIGNPKNLDLTNMEELWIAYSPDIDKGTDIGLFSVISKSLHIQQWANGYFIGDIASLKELTGTIYLDEQSITCNDIISGGMNYTVLRLWNNPSIGVSGMYNLVKSDYDIPTRTHRGLDLRGCGAPSAETLNMINDMITTRSWDIKYDE